ncbi:hypothetical protein SUGI_0424110 [Cryptomeria japonica]|nr:hypothetical protein SUGI_0424110 [Cryptomeria japonica]
METSETKQRRRNYRVGFGKHKGKKTEEQGSRRIYDPRRWRKRSNKNKVNGNIGNISLSGRFHGEPAAGWMLVWAGRFKRWRRRWFVAHPPGLLLYYKNSEQIGRPGCISLLGSTVVAIPGKDTQYKIVKDSVIYYLRTATGGQRQAWIDAIHQSIHTYNTSLQKAVSGTIPPESVMSHQRIPAHAKVRLEEQEKELQRRLSTRMQEIEPFRQAFLQQLQTHQGSVSVLSSLSTVAECEIATQTQRRYLNENQMHGQSVCTDTGFIDKRSRSTVTHSTIRRKAGHSRNATIGDGEFGFHDLGGCIGRELFRRRKRGGNVPYALSSGSLSDTEVKQIPFSSINQNINFPVSKTADTYSNCTKRYVSHGDDANNHGDKILKCSKDEGKPFEQRSTTSFDKDNQPASDNPLYSSWNQIQDAFSKALKEEIRRGVLLEAENAALKESFSMLPHLQEYQNEIFDSQEKNLSESSMVEVDTAGKLYRENIEEEQDVQDSDDEISCVSTNLTNEEYFEALEVLNQHDYMVKGIASQELEELGEEVDLTEEPPEIPDLQGDADILSEPEGEEYVFPRTRLPAPKPISRGFSLWTILKNAIGKDLTQITMPATLNEPLSMLQRCAEEMQYRHLLEKASQLDDSIERLLWVSAFACATYHGSLHRDYKPFNPLLGETYEWQAPDNTARFISEQVSHHPPIMSFFAESTSRDYIFYGEVEIKNKFWGRSVEVLPAGIFHLHFPKYNDHYTWNKVSSSVHNIIIGKLWLDNYGEMLVHNHRTKEVARIQFHKANNLEHGRISGKIFNDRDVPQISIYGNYMDEIFSSVELGSNCHESYSSSRCIWKHPDPPEDYQQQYCFNHFAIGLNEMKPELQAQLPCTDARFRPDQRALENGDVEKATYEKYRLEEKQRAACKWRKDRQREWKCMWFQQRDPRKKHVNSLKDGDIEPTWVYNGEYWSARERKAFQNCPDIM